MCNELPTARCGCLVRKPWNGPTRIRLNVVAGAATSVCPHCHGDRVVTFPSPKTSAEPRRVRY